jgi:hypothetical protein
MGELGSGAKTARSSESATLGCRSGRIFGLVLFDVMSPCPVRSLNGGPSARTRDDLEAKDCFPVIVRLQQCGGRQSTPIDGILDLLLSKVADGICGELPVYVSVRPTR